MKVSGIEVVAQFCVTRRSQRRGTLISWGWRRRSIPPRCSCWEARPCFLRLGLPGQDAVGRACTSTLRVSTRRTKR